MDTFGKRHKLLLVTTGIAAIIVSILYYDMKKDSPTAINKEAKEVIFQQVSSTATQAERRARVQYAVDQAVPAESIFINKCAPTPFVARFVKGSTIRFVNRDDKARNIYFTPSQSFVIPAQGEKAVTFNFWDKSGVRTYKCDGSDAGAVLVTD